MPFMIELRHAWRFLGWASCEANELRMPAGLGRRAPPNLVDQGVELPLGDAMDPAAKMNDSDINKMRC
jgi:hypothetical protein